jgi:TPR repeat protein
LILKKYSIKHRKYALIIASIFLIAGSLGLYNITHVKSYIKRKISLAEIDKQFEHLEKMSKMNDKLVESFEISETDPQKALSIVKEQVEKGFPHAIILLGQYHILGEVGCEINFKKGVALIEEGLEKERQELDLRKKKGFIENTDKEYASYLKLNAHNLYYLSIAYLEGDKFLLPDISKGVMYLKQSADLGYNRACYELARTYLFGKYEVQKNISKAIAYATQAADKGNILAQSLLGIMYMDYSFGVPEDIEKSVIYLTLASENTDMNNEEQIEKRGGSQIFTSTTLS